MIDTTQQLINALHAHAHGLRTPTVVISDENGDIHEIVNVTFIEDDGRVFINVIPEE